MQNQLFGVSIAVLIDSIKAPQYETIFINSKTSQ